MAACGRSPDKPSAPLADAPAARTPPPASVVRLLRAGGHAEAYSIPALDREEWRSETAPAIDTLVGADYERHLIVVSDRKHNLVSLDLDERKVRTLAPQVRIATVGPDGTVYAVDTGRTILQISRRTTTRFPGRLASAPAGLFAGAGGTALALESGRVAVAGSDASRHVAVPRGPVAVTFWGDLLAVGTDSGVVLMDPQSRRQPVTIGGSAKARALVFSPSGHRLYAAGSGAEVLVIDRFGHSVLKRIRLPAAAADLRIDFFGNWLLAHAARGDSVWVVDLDAERVVGTLATAWSGDLPAVAAPRTLVARRDRDVVALDLASPALTEVGRVKGGATDIWVPVSWAPAAAVTPDATADTAQVAATPTAARPDTAAAAADTSRAPDAQAPVLYLQVSSSRNPDWANDLASRLRAAGLAPSVLKPAGADETYRVVLGPFTTREAAEETSRRLGMPSFVITARGDSGR